MEHLSECYLSCCVELGSAESTQRKLLLDAEGADAVGYIGSPGEYPRRAQHDVMCIEKTLIDALKPLL